MITCTYQLLKTGFCQSQVFQEHLSLILVQLGNLFLDLCTDYKYLTVLFGRILTYSLYMCIICTVICNIVFRNIGSINNRLSSKKIVSCKPCILILILCLKSNCKLAVFQMCLYFFEECKLFGCFLIHTCSLGNLCNSSLKDLKI